MNYPTPSAAEPPRERPLLRIGASLPGIAEPTERADAARNRQLLLDAAQDLVREHGVDSLTMDELAKRAGVGKGTVFRRFGNRSGLMHALLDHSEQKYQGAFMFGPPPLGPGAPPVDRLVAFGRVRILDIEVEGELYRAAEVSEAENRYTGRPYNLLKTHVAMLLQQAGTPGEIPLLADGLLATLAAPLVMYQLNVLGYDGKRIGDNWEAFVRRVVPAAAPVE
ncbi:TetR/AcrR family transcriptional regulator [Nocardia bhagyanarayanae]|uniref:TetR family transcriptional regulator n=1 Tax=Nocardia bhagyanarayanae TaxID=1215925 RepID=A0A543FBN3_9NOCA|nr:TetR/AcrR family transcriptional regulator [Nocardia bhagyanarayanae]TQM31196.1 TetR family transcriptional regulator [Nocardia bhagyanarayanae]